MKAIVAVAVVAEMIEVEVVIVVVEPVQVDEQRGSVLLLPLWGEEVEFVADLAHWL